MLNVAEHQIAPSSAALAVTLPLRIVLILAISETVGLVFTQRQIPLKFSAMLSKTKLIFIGSHRQEKKGTQQTSSKPLAKTSVQEKN